MKLLLASIFSLLTFMTNAADYFWVGGSGNWSDISHWAAISGGTVKYPVAPSSEDNVFFDENSFTGPNQVVSFVNEIIFCKSMDWSAVTNNPRLAGPRSVTLSIFGDLTLTPNMVLDFEGKFLFTGIAENKRINLADLQVNGALTFAGESTWDMDSGINVDTILELSRGNLNLNGLPIICRFLHINTAGQKSIDIRNSNVQINGAYQDEFGYDGDGSISFYMENAGLELQAEGSVIEISAPGATFHHYGPRNDIQLGIVNFSAPGGSVYMTSGWFDEQLLFRELSFNSSALVEGTIHAENISFGAGGRYRFGAERAYVFGTISAAGDCVEGVIITSDNPGFASDFTVATGTIDLEYLTLRDIHGSGGAALNANNGVDLGNNDGWIFTNSLPVDFYWIGGTGMWDDPAHWSFSSGGPSSGCVPAGKDNAFFDANSFSGPNQSVSLNSRATFIHNMVWNGVNGNPEFTGEEIQRIVVTGSVEFDANMEHDVEGFYNFESNEVGNTIRMNGNIFNQSITFSGVLAEWTFLDDVEVYRRVYLGSGTVRTGGHQFTMTRLESNSEQNRILDISDSYVLLRESFYLNPEWNVDLENYVVIADNSTIEFTESGIFNHDGYANASIPNYNLVIFSNDNSGVRSINQSTDEDEPGIIIDDLSFDGRGGFTGSSHIRILRLADGFSYAFDSGYDRRQLIDELITQGSCGDGLTQFFGSDPGNTANIDLSVSLTLERMYIQDINLINGSLINNNSIDGGNNNNMTFNELAGRTLYWVGDEGVWQDPNHWSLSSGGPGGECIPTAIDDVYFDDNSFTLDAQLVNSIPSTFAYCHNITILGTTGGPQLQLNFLLVNGSLEYDMSFLNNINEHIFISSDPSTIAIGGQFLNNVRFRGSGTFDFVEDFIFNRWNHNAGIVNFNDRLVHGSSMSFNGGAEKILNLEESRIILEEGGSAFDDGSDYLVVNPGTSEMNFTGNTAGIFSRNQLVFNKVNFPNTQGTGFFASRRNWDNDDVDGTMSASNVQFNGNGVTLGHLVVDTLVGVAGKVYTFDSERTVSVSSYLQLRGNNCTPIELRSSSNAIKAIIEMPANAEVVVDFVQMNDIIGTGGADFNAGSRSVDVGNSNVGWVFEDAPDFIDAGFLGMDRAICEGEPVELVAFSYSPNEEYLWSDGSMDSVVTVDESGVYFVEVQFESDCVLRDTITIVDSEVFEPELPENSNICRDGSVLLDAQVAFEGASYLWSDGSTDASLEVSDPGVYVVEIEALGCSTFDSTTVEIVDDPGAFLPVDTSVCEGNPVLINALISGDEYGWQDASDDAFWTGTEDGIKWLDITLGGCVFRDSIMINTLASPAIELGGDTIICDNEVLVLALSQDYDYLWQDGTVSNEYNISAAGNYVVTAEQNGCISIDSVQVSLRPAPVVDLGEDYSVCASESVVLMVENPNNTNMWDDGTTRPERNITEPGIYWLDVEENGCLGRDTVVVEFLALPILDLGVDVIVCEQDLHIVKPISISNGDLTWQDGTTLKNYDVISPGLITATVFDGLCENTDSVLVSFKECTFFEIYIPNAFSPNDDGNNDLFEVFIPENLIVNSYSMEIFDRWGSRVFKSSGIEEQWDGNIDTESLANGVYIYFLSIDYVDENGPGSEELSGDIAVFR